MTTPMASAPKQLETKPLDKRFFDPPFTVSDTELAECAKTTPGAREWYLAILAHAHLYRNMQNAQGGFLLSPVQEIWLARHFEDRRDEYVAIAEKAVAKALRPRVAA